MTKRERRPAPPVPDLANTVEWRDAEARLRMMESRPHGVRLIIRRDEERRYEQELRERAAREEEE